MTTHQKSRRDDYLRDLLKKRDAVILELTKELAKRTQIMSLDPKDPTTWPSDDAKKLYIMWNKEKITIMCSGAKAHTFYSSSINTEFIRCMQVKYIEII